MADKEKDTRDILISWSLILPTLLGIVKANKNLPRLAELQDLLIRYLRGRVSMSDVISGRKAIRAVLTKDVELEKFVEARKQAWQDHLTGKTGKEFSSNISAKFVEDIEGGKDLVETKIDIHTRDTLASRIDVVRENLGKRIEDIKNRTGIKTSVLNRKDAIKARSTFDLFGAQVWYDMFGSTGPISGGSAWDMMDAHAWFRAYKTSGHISFTGNTQDLEVNSIRSRLSSFDTSPESADVDILKKYVTELERIEKQFEAPQLKPISGSRVKDPIWTSIIGNRVATSNGRITTIGGKEVMGLGAIESSIQQSLLGELEQNLAPPKQGFQTRFEDIFYNYSPQTQRFYDVVLSPQSQAKEVAKVFRSMSEHLGRLKRGGANTVAAKLAKDESTQRALTKVINNMELRLEVTEEHALGRPFKYFKFVLDSSGAEVDRSIKVGDKTLDKLVGRMEFYFPTVQEGYLITRPGVHPLTSPATWPAGAKGISQFMSIPSTVALDITQHMPKFYNEMMDAMLRGDRAQNYLMRRINHAMELASPAKGTVGDIFRIAAAKHVEGRIYAGLEDSRMYINALKAKSAVENVKRMHTTGKSRILVFDTEYGKEGLLSRSLGVQRMARDPGVKVWSIGYQILDYEASSGRMTGIMGKPGKLMIKPKNWNSIKSNVEQWLRRQLPDEKAVEKIINKIQEGEGLREALKKLVDDIRTYGKNDIYVSGFASMDADLKNLAQMIDAEFSKKEALEWKTQLSYLLDVDMEHGARRQIDVMRLYQGFSFARPETAISNAAVFESLYGIDSTRFGELLTMVKGKKQVELKVAAKKLWSSSSEIAKAEHAFKTFENMKLGVTEYHSHMAEFDWTIHAMSMKRLFGRVMGPNTLDREALERLSIAAEIQRNRLAGYKSPWHYVTDTILNPLFASTYSVSSFDGAGTSYSDPNMAQLSLHAMPKAQAARMIGSLLNPDRVLPGGLLHNLLRQKYQSFSGHILSVNTGLMFKDMHADMTQVMKEADLPFLGIGEVMGTPHTTAMRQHIINTYMGSYGNYARNNLRVTLGDRAAEAAMKKTTMHMTDSIIGLVAYLPDRHGYTHDAALRVNKAIFESVNVLGHGDRPGIRNIELEIPIPDEWKNKSGMAIKDVLKRQGFHPAIQRLAREYGGRVSGIVDKRWEYFKMDVLGEGDISDRIIHPGDELIKEVQGRREYLRLTDVGRKYDKKYPAAVVGMKVDLEQNNIIITVSEHSRPMLTTKISTGSTKTLWGTASSKVENVNTKGRAVGGGMLLLEGSIKSLKDYGAIVMAQIGRVLRHVYSSNLGPLGQEGAIKKALTPLLGKDLVEDITFQDNRLLTTGGRSIVIRKPELGNKIQTHLSRHSASVPKLYDMVEAAGITIGEVRKLFNIITSNILESETEREKLFNQLGRDHLNSLEREKDRLLGKIATAGEGRSKKEIERSKNMVSRQIRSWKAFVERQDESGTALFDFMATKPFADSAVLTSHNAIIALESLHIVESGPIDFMRSFDRMESFYGFPLGPQKLSPADANVLEDAVRRAAGEDIAALEIMVEMDKMRGFAYISKKTGRPIIRESIQAVNLAMKFLREGRPALAAALGEEGTTKILNYEAVQQLAEKSGFIELMSTKDMESVLTKLDAITDERHVGRKVADALVDMGILGAKEGMSEHDLMKLLNDFGISGPDVEYFTDVINQDRIHLVDKTLLNEIKMFRTTKGSMKDITLLEVQNTSSAIKALKARVGKSRADVKRVEKLEGWLKNTGRTSLYKEGFTFDLREHLFGYLMDNPNMAKGKTDILLRQVSNYLERMAKRGSLRVGADFIPIPKAAVLMSILQSSNLSNLLGGKNAFLGGAAVSTLEVMRDVMQFNQATKDIAGLGDGAKKSVEELIENWTSKVQQLEHSIGVLQERVIGPSVSQLIKKAFTLYAPTSYGKLLHPLHLLPTLQNKLYGAPGGLEKALSNFPKSEVIKINNKVFAEIDIKKAFANLVDAPSEGGSQLFGPMDGGLQRIRFKGLGVNEAIMPMHVAKEQVIRIAKQHGGSIPKPKLVRDWLMGKTASPFPIHRGKQPIIYSGTSLAKVYVVPDVLWELHGGLDIDVKKQSKMGNLHGLVYIDPVAAISDLADWDGDLGMMVFAGNTPSTRAIQAATNRTEELVKYLTWKQKVSGDAPLDRVTDAVTVDLDPENFKKTGRVTYMVPNKNYKKVIDTTATLDIFPVKDFYDRSNHDFTVLKTSLIDEYITNELVTGRLGNMHKYLQSQVLGKPSVWEQLSHELSDNKKLAKFLKEEGISALEVQEAVHYILNKEAKSGMKFATAVEKWSGNLVEVMTVQKILGGEQISGSSARLKKDLINKILSSNQSLLSGSIVDESQGVVNRLALMPEKPDASLMQFISPDKISRLSDADVRDMARVSRKLTVDVGLIILASQKAAEFLNKPDAFGVTYIKKALDSSTAAIQGNIGFHFSLMAGLGASAKWEDFASGIFGKDNLAYSLSEFQRGMPMSGRRTILESIKTGIREHVGEEGYRSLGKSVKWAGLAALALMALDPNANSKLLGPTPGEGGEKYDLPTIQSILDVYKQKKPRLLEPSATMMDKLATLTGLPIESLPQLKQGRNLPPRPSIRYNNRRKKYSRHNIGQYIRDGNGVLLT